MQILLCPDSFKGSLAADAVCAALKKGILSVCPTATVYAMPMADGGEGTLALLSALLHQKPVQKQVHQAYGNLDFSEYLYFEKEQTAVIESAQAIGLSEIDKNYLCTKKASSKGVGELIADAVLQKGAKKILLTLGGTATTDGGMGALSEMGVLFLDEVGQPLSPIGENMSKVMSIQKTPLFSAFQEVQFYFAADVTSTFCGKNGAAFVFAAQKGATAEEILMLDKGLFHIAGLYEKAFSKNILEKQGAGAAGGLLGGIFAACGGEILDSFSLLKSLYHIEKHLPQTDFILTGEGKTDAQTALQKLPIRVLNTAKSANVPCILISGKIETAFDAKAFGFYDAISLEGYAKGEEDSMRHAARYLEAAAASFFRKEQVHG